VRVESSTGYTAPWFDGVAERMAALVPDARLIFMVREPIDRMISHYLHYYLRGTERRPIGEALADFESRYVVRSRYYAQLEPLLERFPSENLFVGTQEDLLHRRRDTMRAVYRFLGVDSSFWSRKMERLRNPTAGEGRGFVLADRIRRLPGSGLAYRLPEELKWLGERLLYSRGSKAPARPALDEGLRARLTEYLADDLERFRRAVGRDFPGWCESG
jgi:Sulfotransferase family